MNRDQQTEGAGACRRCNGELEHDHWCPDCEQIMPRGTPLVCDGGQSLPKQPDCRRCWDTGVASVYVANMGGSIECPECGDEDV